ncbi:hypothetical protein BO70DRAFT_431650 [Aspergillus heteromorphus CBS 117.55]|uniref:Uncharacterized protein n=1 Tax=Aspergillus heteromorphus CBS 117.55 TaxID=1448321 RepID=A0A317VK28_9EURO|nr:uncharacterized protein BO70DRAFT_431650 [Aspergillus heteromorphus CBS 117.55]PWY72260.1 hypothetical protein BO70DRAFT_431650 [Aspergillus heteromorphus CBS 117.55]
MISEMHRKAAVKMATLSALLLDLASTLTRANYDRYGKLESRLGQISDTETRSETFSNFPNFPNFPNSASKSDSPATPPSTLDHSLSRISRSVLLEDHERWLQLDLDLRQRQ